MTFCVTFHKTTNKPRRHTKYEIQSGNSPVYQTRCKQFNLIKTLIKTESEQKLHKL